MTVYVYSLMVLYYGAKLSQAFTIFNSNQCGFGPLLSKLSGIADCALGCGGLSATVGRKQWDVLCDLRAPRASTLRSRRASVRSVLRFGSPQSTRRQCV